MSQNFKKWIASTVTYNDKERKHKHEYTEPYILEITNKNIHATGNYYNRCEYFKVLKCKDCISFTSFSEEGNYLGSILGDVESFLSTNTLPFIYADTMEKNPVYSFNKLENVRLKK